MIRVKLFLNYLFNLTLWPLMKTKWHLLSTGDKTISCFNIVFFQYDPCFIGLHLNICWWIPIKGCGLNHVIYALVILNNLFAIVVIDAWRSYAWFPRPRINLWAWLTRPHVPHAGFMPKIAHFGIVALLRSVLIIALERLEIINPRNRCGIPDPLQSLPVGDDPYIWHLINEIQEHYKTFLVVRLCEPGGVVEETERRSIRCVMSIEILQYHLVNTFSFCRISTSVTHWTTSPV